MGSAPIGPKPCGCRRERTNSPSVRRHPQGFGPMVPIPSRGQPGGLMDRSRGLSEERAIPPVWCAHAMHPGWGGGDVARRFAISTVPAPLPGCALLSLRSGGIARYTRSTPGYCPSTLWVGGLEGYPGQSLKSSSSNPSASVASQILSSAWFSANSLAISAKDSSIVSFAACTSSPVGVSVTRTSSPRLYRSIKAAGSTSTIESPSFINRSVVIIPLSLAANFSSAISKSHAQ